MTTTRYTNLNSNPPTGLCGWQDANRESVEIEEANNFEEDMNLYRPKLILEKYADRCFAVVGDIVTYTIKATHEGIGTSCSAIEDVNIFDLLPSALKFVKNSVMLEHRPMPEASLLRGINIGILCSNQTKVLTFKAEVVGEEKECIINTVTGEYRYNRLGRNKQIGMAESNPYHLKVYKTSLKLIKTADVEQVNLGDVITYKIQLINEGDLGVYNVNFTDQLPPQVALIPESFQIGCEYINGVELDQGITIPFIPSCHKSVLTYKVRVVGSNCCSKIINQAQAKYEYYFPDNTVGYQVVTGPEGTATVQLNLTTFKELTLESYLTIPQGKPSIENINQITGVIDSVAYHVIKTTEVTSAEGQQLSGYKLVVRGNLTVVIEYTALNEIQSIHSTWYTVPFSTFIILPSLYKFGSKLDIEGIVENMRYNVMDIRTFVANATVLMNVKILGC